MFFTIKSIIQKRMLASAKRISFNFAYSEFDECEIKTHNCSANAVCNNTKRSHNCTCKPGYSGNGQICKSDFGRVLPCITHSFAN